MSNPVNLSTILNEISLQINDNQLDRLSYYVKLLLRANQTTNLTAITDFDEALLKHIYDSLLIMTLLEFRSAKSIIDVGSGGGLPGIPLAICNPEKKIVSLEATQKKVNFQIKAAQTLNLANFYPVWGRAETLANQNDHREQYDLAIARAVAPLNILAELTVPFVKLTGHAIFYKGKEVEKEIFNGTQAVNVLGAAIKGTKSFVLPYDYGARFLVILNKMNHTLSNYPRKPGIPQKRPL